MEKADIGVPMERDVVCGSVPVGHGSAQPTMRPLLVDVYLPPTGAPSGPARAAVLLAHGGAFHRGSKSDDAFAQDGSPNTPVSEYCQILARQGYVCFSLDYRLTQECPPPQPTPILQNRSVSSERVNFVRNLMGLPPATSAQLIDGVEAAISDIAAAFTFVAQHAARWNIDPARMALGGFSSGAIAASYACYALGAPAAAIISLSGGMAFEDAAHYLGQSSHRAPALLFSSELDLPEAIARTEELERAGQAAGVPLQRYLVPGKPHFYARSSPAVRVDAGARGSAQADTVEKAITVFLANTLHRF